MTASFNTVFTVSRRCYFFVRKSVKMHLLDPFFNTCSGHSQTANTGLRQRMISQWFLFWFDLSSIVYRWKSRETVNYFYALLDTRKRGSVCYLLRQLYLANWSLQTVTITWFNKNVSPSCCIINIFINFNINFIFL